MATSVTCAIWQTTTPSHSSTTNQTKTSFLNRCIEDLSSDKVASFEKKANQWNTLYIVSTVAFFTLAVVVVLSILPVAALIAASIFVPANAHFAAMGVIAVTGASLLDIPALRWSVQFQKWSLAAQNEAEKYQAIQHNYADLTARTPQELQRILSRMGIIWNHIPGMEIQHPENLSRLNPLLAQARYLENQTEYCMSFRDKFGDEARHWQTITTDSAKYEKAKARHLALLYEDEALNLRIQSAFVNAVLRKSDFCGTLEDLGALSKANYEDRTLGNALRDPTVDQMLTFNDRNLAPITFNDVKTMSVEDLGQRIFAAMAV